jgi:hypothetical protein
MKAAGLVQEPADYVRLPYYPGPCHLDEFTALLHQVTRARARDHLGKLLLDQRQMDVPAEQVHLVQPSCPAPCTTYLPLYCFTMRCTVGRWPAWCRYSR